MMSRPDTPRPPRLARKLLRRFCARQWLEEIEGDLEEQFAAQVGDEGLFAAQRTYWRDVLLFAGRAYVKRRPPVGYHLARGPFMLINYLKIALRNLKRHTGYTVINVTGLAVGMACCLLILLYVQDERSYDLFHEKGDRIYRLEREVSRPGGEGRFSFTSGPPGPALVNEYPEVEAAVRFFRLESLVRYQDRQFYGEKIAFVDSSFFHVFTFPLRSGDPRTALATPNSVVLTETMAKKYFGNEDPVGQTVRIDNADEFIVMGVVADVPENSHYTFDALASFSALPPKFPWLNNWGGIGIRTYLLLSPNVTAAALEAKLPSFIHKHKGETAQEAYYLRPLKQIHLYSDVFEIDPQGDIETVYLFSAIALFILILAGINYMNLATARAARRAREVGVRKVVGATRWQLVVQFLGESVLLILLALPLALVLTLIALPALNHLLGRHLALAMLNDGLGVMALGTFCLLIGLLAGIYPAFFLTRFQPTLVLKGTHHTARSGALLRKILVATQFAASIALLASTSIVYQQLQYAQRKHLGFNKEHVVNIPLRDKQLLEQADVLQQQLSADPQVVAATVSSSGVDAFSRSTMVGPEKVEDPSGDGVMTGLLWVDPEFIPTMEITLIAGQNFSRERAPESELDVIINETAVREYGWASPQEALGKHVGGTGWQSTVIGVVQDFHNRSLRSDVIPLVMINSRLQDDALLAVRIRGGDVPGTLARFEALWQDLVPDWPFEYAFLDEELDQRYKRDRQTGQLFGAFAGLALFIACLGLFGLAAFTAQQRAKELGIRKVLGATVSNIVLLLSKDFTYPVLVAFAIAGPLSYTLMKGWLDDFAYRIEISWPIFLVAGLTALGIAWLTVSYQSIKAALADPVTSLRHE